ncbi:MAG: F390 synthetase-related protein [Ginsengibacter sp.]
MLFKLKVLFYYLNFRIEKKITDNHQLALHQTKRMNTYAEKVLAKSTFYKKYFKNNKLDWNAIPVIDKEIYMEKFDEINIAGVRKTEAMTVALHSERSRDFTSKINGLTVGLSTGTSGKRGLFLVSETERAKWAALMLLKVIPPKIFKRQKISFFLRANSNLYSSVNSIFFQFSYYDIFKPVENYLEDLNKYFPDILAAQPSILYELALLKSRGALKINPVKIISFAEVLNDPEKIFIQETFGCRIVEVYQCTEGVLGFTCDYGVMHLNERFIHFEKEYIEGKRFYPVITDFSRKSQPIARYKLNDILIEKKNTCLCGSIFLSIEKIEGREDDVLVFIENGKLVKLFPDIISRKIAHYTGNFVRYKIEEVDFNVLKIFIETHDVPGTGRMFTVALEELFTERKIQNIELLFYDKVQHNLGCKYRRIQRCIPDDIFESKVKSLPQ